MTTLETQLQKSGYALTPTRKKIISWIESQKGIFSALDILDSVSELDKVTVYRTLQLLESLDVIDPVLVRGGVQYFEVHTHQKHHHHIVCTECEKSECVPCDYKPILKNFSSVHHTVAMTGICIKCT